MDRMKSQTLEGYEHISATSERKFNRKCRKLLEGNINWNFFNYHPLGRSYNRRPKRRLPKVATDSQLNTEWQKNNNLGTAETKW